MFKSMLENLATFYWKRFFLFQTKVINPGKIKTDK